jgi:hypothetical protein
MIARNAKVTVGNALALWVTLLEDASHPDHRGICVRGEDFYGAILDLSFDEVTAILAAMEAAGMISVGHGNITICNWNKRQFESDAKDPTNAERQRRFKEKRKQNITETEGNGSVTVKKHQIQNTDTEKKESTKEKIPFEDFWEKYPRQRRGDKSQTFSAWQSALQKATAEEILNGLAAYLGSSEVRDGYAKGAAAWLRASRWTWDYSYEPKADKAKRKLENLTVIGAP